MNIPPPLPNVLRIEKKALVIPRIYDFPNICIYTGSTEDLVRVRKRLSWHHPAVYFGILAGLIPYVILVLVLSKVSELSFCMTRSERTRRRLWHLANWCIFLTGIVLPFVGGDIQGPWLYYLSPICLLSSLVIYFTRVRLLYPTKVDDYFASIRGIAPEVMRRLTVEPQASAPQSL